MTSAEGGGGGNQTADESTDKLRECCSDKIADFSSGIYCRAQICQQGDFEGVTPISVTLLRHFFWAPNGSTLY